ncbi:Positive transcriptional regulator, MutR family [Streptococcus sp. DD10]|uniref:Rgg/GadR/MutR family transcriptional regulator n=1 Tax=Streptococcus sp. DD10 TaxID=1777878 RepID=UPI000799C694|nr:Rgg/GadR/MutR family transcriptional regulator [Streptococcus sp. DD10]KXT72430.1 Positive transcriptional regulator, MutR family [Streptococcus sp. DD10]
MIEKMELGEFYKELRLARGLKQSDIACEGLTASQLSKFELGRSMLSADKLMLAIRGINMTYDEFGHKLNNYQESSHVRLGRKIVACFAHQDKVGLEQLLLDMPKEQMADKYIRLNSIVIKNAIHSLDRNFPLSKEDREFVTDYLYAIDSWTWFELYLFCNTTPFLSDQDLIFLSTSLLEKSESFKNLLQNKIYMRSCLLNIISELLERGLFKYISIFETALEEILTPYEVFEKLLLQFLRKIKLFLETKGSNKKEIEDFIQSLEILENPQLLALLKLKFQQYQVLLD